MSAAGQRGEEVRHGGAGPAEGPALSHPGRAELAAGAWRGLREGREGPGRAVMGGEEGG